MSDQAASDEAHGVTPPSSRLPPASVSAALQPAMAPTAATVQKKSALEKASLIVGMVVPLMLGWATWSLTNQQWQSQQRQYQNTVHEQDRSRVMERLLTLGNSATSDRLTAAKALRSYANMNRMDAVLLPGLLPYLASECDETVFRIIKEAALQANRNSPPEPSEAISRDQRTTGIEVIQRSPQCPAQTTSGPVLTSYVATIIAAPPQSFDVGCNENKSGILHVQAPGLSPTTQAVKSATASLANIDNLKEWSVRVINHTETSADVEYHIVGLDRQLFGNCPGGGHGSVVTSFQIGEK